MRQTVGAGHLGRTLAQIGHTAVFPFFCILVFPFARRKITRQGVEEIIVLILKYVLLAGHQLPRVLLLGMVAPFSPLLFHQVAIPCPSDFPVQPIPVERLRHPAANLQSLHDSIVAHWENALREAGNESPLCHHF